MWTRRSVGAPLVAVVVTLTFAACGDDGPGRCAEGESGTPPNCVPIRAQDPCTQSVVDSGNGSTNANAAYYKDFSVPDDGRLDITLDWTVAASRFGVYVVPVHTCPIEELNARSCSFLVKSEPSPASAKPLKVSTPGFKAGNYTWIIGNASTAQESIAFQFVLSKGPCAPLAGIGPGASGAAAETAVNFESAFPLR